MNSVFLSPHFPPNFKNFVSRLNAAGVVVLGLSDEPYENLHSDLKDNLHDYYCVKDMHNYDELVRAMGHFTHRFGKINHIDSQNEYWLETEARLRTDFNIEGIKEAELKQIKSKSEMKQVFLKAGLKAARGKVCSTVEELKTFIAEVGYPVVAKPDIGVGAAKTFKLSTENDFVNYTKEKLSCPYIVEEFINGNIISFDGLVDAEGRPIFTSSLRYSKGVMEAVNEDSDIYYYTVREIEPAVEQAGLATLAAFNVRARFFHFEYFLQDNGTVLPLEVNMRPPGGLTLDMFNYTFDFDCYRLWADMLQGRLPGTSPKRKYFTIYVGRKDHIPYALSHEQVMERFGSNMIQEERINSVFVPAIGNYGYVMRHIELDQLIAIAKEIQRKS